MSVAAPQAAEQPQGAVVTKSEERRAIGVASGTHALHDGYTDLIYVMLPIWQAEFGLTYAEIGILRSLFSGTLAAFQIPSGLLAEKLGPARVLAAGTALAGCGYLLAGASAGLIMLALALIVGGLGASTQHPLASTLVARAFGESRSIKAIGTYNFAGDIGKMTVPAAAALLLTVMAWRPTVAVLGACGFAAALAIIALMPRQDGEAKTAATSAAAAAGGRPRRGFPLLLAIGVLDSATRMPFLTFLPFLLGAKGATVSGIGLALTLVFAGGACGKLVCAFLGARIGVFATVVLTEGFTALGIVALLPLPLEACYALLPLIGVALNGTSSVLYGSVPALVAPENARAPSASSIPARSGGRDRAILYEPVGDLLGVPSTLALLAAMVLVTIPLAVALRPALAEQRS